MDGISAFAFGLDTNCFQEKDSAFIKCAKLFFKQSWTEMLMLVCMLFLPGLGRVFQALNINFWKVSEF
jgi:hypothetical protein